MTNSLTGAAALAAFAFLSACGGSGGSVPSLSFSGYEDLGADIAERIEDYEPTAFADLPRAGTTTYDGVMVGGIARNAAQLAAGNLQQEIAGAVEIEADFAENALSGRITNIRNSNNRAFDGTLRIRDGNIGSLFGTGVATAELRGTLTRPNGNEIKLRGEYFGIFAGPDGRAQAAALEGTSNEEGRSGVFEGAIIAD